ncbi:unnamed protein product [Darwinula stevensoni]|uniref:Uncharacterized protein n=1 Tax=Darwinula stevensoni TaxID=69355 RepID=A0A7R9A045_9CRUS|nr:unnamed protein product [Darwinula stevensoni]CAG0884809.1 unnamed protein product [Darwinula stevensoni]
MDREDGAFWRFMAKKPRTAFDNPKPTYSVATRDLLETLMKEARLSQLQRKRLLSPSSESTPTVRVPVDVKRPAPVKTKQTRKRPLTAIVKSGVLEREQFNPRNATKGRDPGEKERLQDIMAYGRPLKPENSELLGLEMTIRYEKGPDKPRMEEAGIQQHLISCHKTGYFQQGFSWEGAETSQLRKLSNVPSVFLL